MEIKPISEITKINFLTSRMRSRKAYVGVAGTRDFMDEVPFFVKTTDGFAKKCGRPDERKRYNNL